MKKLILILPVLALLAWGCASVAPGNDALVVRAEQVETNAAGTLNLVVTLDNAARPFFATNLPPFHAFCEWLRQPVLVNGTNFPRGLGLVASLDSVKRDYQASRASSNTLYSAVTTLESTVNQGAQWLAQLTNNPAH